jgi:hypothetical protein
MEREMENIGEKWRMGMDKKIEKRRKNTIGIRCKKRW